MIRDRLLSLVAIFILALLVGGCAGGGSAGTGSVGIERTFQGSVVSAGVPVEGAKVTLLNTGTETYTDAAGLFELSGVVNTDLATLGLTAEVGEAEQIIEVPLGEPDATVVSVTITLDAQNLVESTSRFYMWARIVGTCARYFANEEIIRQVRKTPSELPCTMRFFVNGDVNRLEGIPGAMQVRSCDSDLWRTLSVGSTGSGSEAGVGEIDFTFINNQRNCEYRIVAPFDASPLPELSVLVQTLTYQREKRR